MSTITNTPDDRRSRTAELRKAHQEYFDNAGINNAKFIPKLAYKPPGKDEMHVGFFLNEMRGEEDVYTEFASKNIEIEDPERNLYKWRYNSHWEEEYDKTEPGPSGAFRYLVPVSELVKIHKELKPKAKLSTIVEKTNAVFELMNPDMDAPLDQLTVRDLAAILLKKPVSSKQWLNKLITDK